MTGIARRARVGGRTGGAARRALRARGSVGRVPPIVALVTRVAVRLSEKKTKKKNKKKITKDVRKKFGGNDDSFNEGKKCK